MTTLEPLQNAVALGQSARRARKAQGLTLKALGDRAGLGIRFLSEFERGKETAELGKSLAALTTLGLKVMLLVDGEPNQDATDSIPLTVPEAPPLVQTRDADTAPPAAPNPVPASRPAAGGDAARLWDMVVAVDDTQQVLQVCGAEPALHQSTVFNRALERCFAVLGEAARRVTPRSQARFQQIPWREIIMRRNGLVMNYEHVDHAALGRAANEELPNLKAELQAALAALDTRAAGQTSVT